MLGVTEIADTLPEAIAKSYEAVKTVKFDNAFYRNDIGKKALAARYEMVYRIYVEKKQGLTAEADALRNDIVNLLGIKGLTGLRLAEPL